MCFTVITITIIDRAEDSTIGYAAGCFISILWFTNQGETNPTRAPRKAIRELEKNGKYSFF